MGKGKKIKNQRETLELVIAKLQEALELAQQQERERERELVGAGK